MKRLKNDDGWILMGFFTGIFGITCLVVGVLCLILAVMI